MGISSELRMYRCLSLYRNTKRNIWKRRSQNWARDNFFSFASKTLVRKMLRRRCLNWVATTIENNLIFAWKQGHVVAAVVACAQLSKKGKKTSNNKVSHGPIFTQKKLSWFQLHQNGLTKFNFLLAKFSSLWKRRKGIAGGKVNLLFSYTVHFTRCRTVNFII